MKILPSMGDQIATPSHNRTKKVVPIIAPVMLPIPPTINIPSHQIESMNEFAEKAGYPVSDMGVYIQPIVQGTGCHCEFNLFYDPENASDVARVRELSTSAVKGLMAKGAFFSRPYGENAGIVINKDAATVGVLKKLKNMFDPNYIMNPGKVCF